MAFWVLPAVAAGIGALTGAMKNNAAKKQENADRELAAATQQNSPWTGLQAQPIRRAGSAFGDVFGGALSGGLQGASLQSAFGAPAAAGKNTWENLAKAPRDANMMMPYTP